jgi:hypothetical protein
MNSIIIKFDNTSDINAAYNQLKRQYPKNKISKTDIDIDEILEDEHLLALALEREKNGSGKTYSFEEILAEDGLTIEEIDNMEDVELEYELPS